MHCLYVYPTLLATVFDPTTYIVIMCQRKNIRTITIQYILRIEKTPSSTRRNFNCELGVKWCSIRSLTHRRCRSHGSMNCFRARTRDPSTVFFVLLVSARKRTPEKKVGVKSAYQPFSFLFFYFFRIHFWTF